MISSDPNLIQRLRKALDGRYRVHRELGRGGMGIVYLADEIALDRPVALKLLPPTLAAKPRQRERFLREARTAARLSHPNIVPVFQVDQVGGFVFFTMAYVEGQTLARRIRALGPLPVDEATWVLREVAWAVAYAHAQGVIHRDLKAENIMLERGSGRALVMDFGIAHVREQPETTDKDRIVGTIRYMSPEQALGGRVDERSDVYSLGVVGYVSISGTFPFHGTTMSEILHQQLDRPAPLLTAVGPESGDVLARAVNRCLVRRPDERWQTAAQLADALEIPAGLPLPLRAFLNKLRSTSWSHAGMALIGFIAFGEFASALVRNHWIEAWLAAGVTALVLAVPVALLLPVTRRALRAGYDRADIVRALSTHVEQEQEELAFQFGRDAGPTERIAAAAAYSGLGIVAVGAAMGLVGPFGPAVAGGTMILGVVTTVTAGIVAAHRFQRRSDQAVKRWLWFWHSALGRWATRLAGVGLRHLPSGATPTSTAAPAIALAALRLFENLPEAARNALRDMPDVLRRLELQTWNVRQFLAELDGSAGRDGDSAQRYLTQTVTALETLRLQLHGLHDGTATLDSLTGELAVAREVREAVDRLLANRQDA